jgi:hypothetical protein
MIILYFYRITNCKYSRIGCPWRGPFHEATEHEKVCVHPHRSGAEVMEALQVIDLKCEEEKRLYNCVFDLLSYEKITFNGMTHCYFISGHMKFILFVCYLKILHHKIGRLFCTW